MIIFCHWRYKFDGIFILTTNRNDLEIKEVVDAYKNLKEVEMLFDEGMLTSTVIASQWSSYGCRGLCFGDFNCLAVALVITILAGSAANFDPVQKVSRNSPT